MEDPEIPRRFEKYPEPPMLNYFPYADKEPAREPKFYRSTALEVINRDRAIKGEQTLPAELVHKIAQEAGTRDFDRGLKWHTKNLGRRYATEMSYTMAPPSEDAEAHFAKAVDYKEPEASDDLLPWQIKFSYESKIDWKQDTALNRASLALKRSVQRYEQMERARLRLIHAKDLIANPFGDTFNKYTKDAFIKQDDGEVIDRLLLHKRERFFEKHGIMPFDEEL